MKTETIIMLAVLAWLFMAGKAAPPSPPPFLSEEVKAAIATAVATAVAGKILGLEARLQELQAFHDKLK